MIDAFSAFTTDFKLRPSIILSETAHMLPPDWKHQAFQRKPSHLGTPVTKHFLIHEPTETALIFTNLELGKHHATVRSNLPRIAFNSQGRVISNKGELHLATKKLTELLSEIIEPTASAFFFNMGDTCDPFCLKLTEVEVGFQFDVDHGLVLQLLSTCRMPRLHKNPSHSLDRWKQCGKEIETKVYPKQAVMTACGRTIVTRRNCSRIEFTIRGKKLQKDARSVGMDLFLRDLRVAQLVRLFKHYLRKLEPFPTKIPRSDDGVLAELIAICQADHFRPAHQDAMDFCAIRMSASRRRRLAKHVQQVRISEIGSLFDLLIPPGTPDDDMPPPANIEEIHPAA